MQAVEDLLTDLGVQHLILPSVKVRVHEAQDGDVREGPG